MSVYSERGGAAGAAMAASETDHLECRRLAFRECNRETLTLREGGEERAAGRWKAVEDMKRCQT